MKKLLLALLLLAANFGRGYAQQAPADYEAPRTAFADSINRVFAAVDKSRINSGILEEYGLQFIDHAPFTGTNGFTVDNQLDINRWRAIYGDLQGARINTNSASMVSLASANQALDLYARDAYVELPILHYNYHSIAIDALSAGRIRSVNNRLFDVAGQNPYQLNSAFAVAASSPVSWQQINLHGEFDFSDEALKDSLCFDVEALFAFQWEPPAGPLV